MSKKTIKDIDLKGKKVLVRCDFNVPMDEERNITDNTRIVAALPTIKYLLENNCAIILCSHLGRPKGEFKPEFSLEPVSKELSKLLDKEAIDATFSLKKGIVVAVDFSSKSAGLMLFSIFTLDVKVSFRTVTSGLKYKTVPTIRPKPTCPITLKIPFKPCLSFLKILI